MGDNTMGKKLESILDQFSELSPDKQLEKIQKIRDTRTIERPAVAKRRRKAEKTRSVKRGSKLKKLLEGMTPEEKEAFLRKLEDSDG